MAKQICSKCGYEGRGKRLGARKGGGLFRLLGMLTMLPIYSLWRLGGGSGGKYCRHCELPTMVKLNSDAGRLAQHMMEVELGLVKVRKPEEKPAEVFGNARADEKMVTKKPVNPEEW